MYIHSDPEREDNPTSLPNIEVFQLTAAEIAERDEDLVHEYSRRREYRLASMNGRVRDRMIEAIVKEQGIEGGWYWQACFPGCLPDGEPMGPFATFAEAVADAQEGN